jgi:predicted dehydrogenase
MGYITGQFVAALAEGRPPMTPGRDALQVTRVIDAAYRSVREETVVGLT